MNRRPLVPQTSALTRLRHAPPRLCVQDIRRRVVDKTKSACPPRLLAVRIPRATGPPDRRVTRDTRPFESFDPRTCCHGPLETRVSGLRAFAMLRCRQSSLGRGISDRQTSGTRRLDDSVHAFAERSNKIIGTVHTRCEAR